MYWRLPASGNSLVRPLAGSLALHLLLLLAYFSPARPPAFLIPAAPLKAVIAPPSPVSQAAPDIGARPPQRLGRVKLQRAESRIAASEAATKVPRSAQTNMAGDAAARDPAAATPAPSRSDAVPAATAPPQTGLAADALRHYVLLLVPEMRRLRRYPTRAQEQGWEGTAEVRLSFGATQALPAVTLAKSSGFSILDEEALRTVGQAAQRVALPDSLRGREVSIGVPVQFHLED